MSKKVPGVRKPHDKGWKLTTCRSSSGDRHSKGGGPASRTIGGEGNRNPVQEAMRARGA